MNTRKLLTGATFAVLTAFGVASDLQAQQPAPTAPAPTPVVVAIPAPARSPEKTTWATVKQPNVTIIPRTVLLFDQFSRLLDPTRFESKKPIKK
jgi:hypothetical protein